MYFCTGLSLYVNINISYDTPGYLLCLTFNALQLEFDTVKENHWFVKTINGDRYKITNQTSLKLKWLYAPICVVDQTFKLQF